MIEMQEKLFVYLELGMVKQANHMLQTNSELANAKNEKGLSPLYFVMDHVKSKIDMLNLLKKYGADFNETYSRVKSDLSEDLCTIVDERDFPTSDPISAKQRFCNHHSFSSKLGIGTNRAYNFDLLKKYDKKLIALMTKLIL
ncbi:MAG: hypothetical protein ACK4OM_00575 [Alphaproteobacteria bacterium]